MDNILSGAAVNPKEKNHWESDTMRMKEIRGNWRKHKQEKEKERLKLKRRETGEKLGKHKGLGRENR